MVEDGKLPNDQKFTWPILVYSVLNEKVLVHVI